MCTDISGLLPSREEEVSFSRTLLKGIEHFQKAAAKAQDGLLDNKAAFTLWVTHGFPIDLTEVCTRPMDMHSLGLLLSS